MSGDGASTYDVAVGNQGEDDVNTIVLAGVDVTVPLEMDADGDPLQDDEVRIRSEDGFFEKVVRASDPDAEPIEDQRLILYHFRAIPPGAYRVHVNVGGRWVEVLRGLVVSRGEVVHAGRALTTERPNLKLGPGHADEPEPADDDEPGESDEPEYMDLNDAYEEG